MARPAWQPTEKDRKQVQAMAAYGIPEKDIARVMGIDGKTLRKHCRTDLDNGATLANSQVAEFLFNAILGRNIKSDQSRVIAAIFWAKTRMNWKETIQHEGTKDGGPIVIKITKDDSDL